MSMRKLWLIMNGDQEECWCHTVLLTYTVSITEVIWTDSGSCVDEACLQNNPLLTC